MDRRLLAGAYLVGGRCTIRQIKENRYDVFLNIILPTGNEKFGKQLKEAFGGTLQYSEVGRFRGYKKIIWTIRSKKNVRNFLTTLLEGRRKLPLGERQKKEIEIVLEAAGICFGPGPKTVNDVQHYRNMDRMEGLYKEAREVGKVE